MSEDILSRSQSSKSLDFIKPKNDDYEGPYDSRKTNFSEGIENDSSANSGSQKDVSQFLYGSDNVLMVVQQMQKKINEMQERLTQVAEENRDTKNKLDELEKQKKAEREKMQYRISALEKGNRGLKNGVDKSGKQEKKEGGKEIVRDSNTNKLISKLTNVDYTKKEVGNAIAEFISEKDKKSQNQSSLDPRVSEKIYGILADVAGMSKWYYKGFTKDEFKKKGRDLNKKSELLKHVLEEFCIRFREYNSASEDSKEVEKKIRNVAKMLSAISLIDENLAKNLFYELYELGPSIGQKLLGTGELTDALILQQIEMDEKGLEEVITEFKKFHGERTNKAKSFKSFYYCDFISGNKKMEPWMLYYFLFAFETKNEKLQKLDGFNEASLPSVRLAFFIYYAAKIVPNLVIGIPLISFGQKAYLETLINNVFGKYSPPSTFFIGLVSISLGVVMKIMLTKLEEKFIKSKKRYFLAKLQEKAAKSAKTFKEAKDKAKSSENDKTLKNEVKHVGNKNVTGIVVDDSQQNAKRSYSVCLTFNYKSDSDDHEQNKPKPVYPTSNKEKEMERGKKLSQVFTQFMKNYKNETAKKSSNYSNTNNGELPRSLSFVNPKEVPCEA